MTNAIRWWILYLTVAVSTLGFAGEAEGELSVSANGLRLVAKAGGTDTALLPFSASAGTTLGLLVSSDAGHMIQFDPENSTLSRFTDDKGNDLLTRAASEKDGVQAGFGMFPKISKDGKNCGLEIFAPNLPAKESLRLRVEGVVTMLCASEKKAVVQKDVALRTGTKLNLEKLELTVDNVGKPDVGDEPLGLTLRSHGKLDHVAEIRFFKADGTEIKSRQTGRSMMAILGLLTVEWNYSLAEKVDSAEARVFIWTDLQKKKLPFKLDVGVGL